MDEYELAIVFWSVIVGVFVALPLAQVAIRALVDHFREETDHPSIPSVPFNSHPSWPG